jgi:MerR family transcriptional regulator, light-induced transcriptional regulator
MSQTDFTADTASDDDDVPLYTVRAVADRIGLPTATLRSWTRRYGVGPLGHRPGRHRLYTERDVVVLRRMQELIGQGVSPGGAARAAADTAGAKPGGTASLLAAAFTLDAATAGRVIEIHLRERGVVDTWDGLLRPAFAALTTLQIEGGGCVDVEHVLSRATARALQRVPISPPAGSPSAILACCDGEVHTLPLEALAAALAQRGQAVAMLGASVPADGIAEALAKLPATKAVVLWAHQPKTADLEAVRVVVAAGARAMVAGPGWADTRLPPGVTRLAHLTAALDRLAANP